MRVRAPMLERRERSKAWGSDRHPQVVIFLVRNRLSPNADPRAALPKSHLSARRRRREADVSWSHLEEERERGVGRAVGAGRGERAAVRERERVEHALERVLTLREER